MISRKGKYKKTREMHAGREHEITSERVGGAKDYRICGQYNNPQPRQGMFRTQAQILTKTKKDMKKEGEDGYQ